MALGVSIKNSKNKSFWETVWMYYFCPEKLTTSWSHQHHSSKLLPHLKKTGLSIPARNYSPASPPLEANITPPNTHFFLDKAAGSSHSAIQHSLQKHTVLFIPLCPVPLMQWKESQRLWAYWVCWSPSFLITAVLANGHNDEKVTHRGLHAPFRGEEKCY